MKRLKCGFGPTVEERIVGEGAKGSSGAMWLFGRVTEGRARSYNHIRVWRIYSNVRIYWPARLYNHIHKVLSTGTFLLMALDKQTGWIMNSHIRSPLSKRSWKSQKLHFKWGSSWLTWETTEDRDRWGGMVVWIILHKVFILTRRSNHFPVQYWFFAEKLFSQNSHFHFPVQYWFLLKNCFSKFSLSQTPLVKEATACWPICGDVFFIFVIYRYTHI